MTSLQPRHKDTLDRARVPGRKSLLSIRTDVTWNNPVSGLAPGVSFITTHPVLLYTVLMWARLHSHNLRHQIRSIHEHALSTGAQYPMIEATAEPKLIHSTPRW